jgi:hypothetical protein
MSILSPFKICIALQHIILSPLFLPHPQGRMFLSEQFYGHGKSRYHHHYENKHIPPLKLQSVLPSITINNYTIQNLKIQGQPVKPVLTIHLQQSLKFQFPDRFESLIYFSCTNKFLTGRPVAQWFSARFRCR